MLWWQYVAVAWNGSKKAHETIHTACTLYKANRHFAMEPTIAEQANFIIRQDLDVSIKCKTRIFLNQLSYPLAIAWRLVQLQCLFAPFIFISPLLLILNRRHLLYAWLRGTLIFAGPAFIKLGQWVAVRPDLLPMELCEALSDLHTHGSIHPLSWSLAKLAESGLDKKLHKKLLKDPVLLDKLIAGSGSVGQVYKGALADGSLVAIKIVHPDIREAFERDLRLIRCVALLLDGLFPSIFGWVDLPRQAALFSQIMLRQTDLRWEAQAARRFTRNFSPQNKAMLAGNLFQWIRGQHKAPAIHFPHVYAATRDVLIQSWEGDSVPIDIYVRERTTDPRWHSVNVQLARLGLRAFLQMILWDNFVHADLHPGNIRVKVKSDINSEEKEEDQLVFLDCGLTTQLRHKDFVDFGDLFAAIIVKRDGCLAARLILERGPSFAHIRQDHDKIERASIQTTKISYNDIKSDVIDPDGYIRDMGKLIDEGFLEQLHPTGPSVSKPLLPLPPITPILLKAFELVRVHHVRLEPAFTNLIMSLICVESMGRSLAGDDLDALPLLFQAATQYLLGRVIHLS